MYEGKEYLMKKKAISMVLTCVILAASMIAPVSGAQMPTDVTNDKWFYESVKFAYDNGIMDGMTPTTFNPDGALTRAQFVTILCRMSGGEKTITDRFTDVAKDKWYAGFVGWAEKCGIVDGMTPTTFAPENSMTRQEMAAAISRYIEYRGIKLPRESQAPFKFTDDDKIAEWAETYVNVLRLSGITKGDDNVNYNPEGNITRAETATIVQRIYDVIDNAWQGYVPNPDEDGFAVYGAKYLYNAGFAVQGGMGTELYTEESPYPALYAYSDKRSAEFSYEPADSFGFSPTAAVADLSKTPVVKICYSYEGSNAPEKLTAYLSNRTAMETTYSTAALDFVKGADDEGWITATCDSTSALSQIPNLSFGTKSGCNVHIMFKPYEGVDEKDGKFLLRYIALFPDAETAENFSSAEYGEYLNDYFLYSSVSYSDVGDDVLEENLGKIRERISEIKNSPSTIKPSDIEAAGGKVYYVSSINGNDSNDGLSPEKAFKTPSALYEYKKGPGVYVSKAKPGDGVFFERGSEFYPGKYYNHTISTLDASKDVTYGAYGDASKPKPVFTGSFDFGGGTGEWKATEWNNIYVMDLTKLLPEDKENFAKEDGDIGKIIFNEGEYMGVRVIPNDENDPFGEGKTTKQMYEQGNCKDYYVSGGTSCKDPADALRHNLEYIHDWKEGKVYLRCEFGNPSTYFKRIDLCRNANIVFSAENARYDNLTFLYSGYIGLDLEDGNVVTWCEAGYCGGDTGSVGTGIGGYGKCDSLVIDNCYIHDIEDGPMGTQNTADYDDPSEVPELNGVVCTDNVIIAAQNLVELFSTHRVEGPDGLGVNKIRNAVVTGNYAAYLGYGYPRCVDGDAEGLALHNWYYGEMVDCEFAYNTMVACEGSIIGAHVASDGNPRGWYMHDNTYVLNPDICASLRGVDGVTFTNLNKSFYASYKMPYSKRYLSYLSSIGIDSNSKFYAFHSATEGEKFGSYVMNGYHVERGHKPA